jgi:hypothetical protein
MRRHRLTLGIILAIGVLVLCSIVGGLLAPEARATSGGATIASAPQLLIGTTFVGGAVSKYEYWWVTLAAGDTLTIDYQLANSGDEVTRPVVLTGG